MVEIQDLGENCVDLHILYLVCVSSAHCYACCHCYRFYYCLTIALYCYTFTSAKFQICIIISDLLLPEEIKVELKCEV